MAEVWICNPVEFELTYRSFVDKLSAHDSLWDKLRKRRNPFEEQPPVSAEAEFPAGMPEGQETPQSIYEKYGQQLQETMQGLQSEEYLSPAYFAKRGQGGLKTTAMTEEQIGEAGGEAIGRQFRPSVPLEEYNVKLRSKFHKTIDQMSADYDQYKQDFGDKAMRPEDWAEYQKGKYWRPEDEQAFANFYEMFATTNADIAIFGAPLLKKVVQLGVAGARAGIKAGARALAPLGREVLAGEAGAVGKGIPKSFEVRFARKYTGEMKSIIVQAPDEIDAVSIARKQSGLDITEWIPERVIIPKGEIPPVGKIAPEGKLPIPEPGMPEAVTPEEQLQVALIKRDPVGTGRNLGYDIHKLSPRNSVDKGDYADGYRYRIGTYPNIFMARNEKEVADYILKQARGIPIIPEVPVTGAVKEPWQMTKDEWQIEEGISEPSRYLYHGTPKKNLEDIRIRGLESKTRQRNDWELGDRTPQEQELLYFERKPNENWGSKQSIQLRINEDMLPRGIDITEDALRPGEFYTSHVKNASYEIPPEAIEYYDKTKKSWLPLVDDEHKIAIKQALSEGKPVPPEVLKDYPDLKPIISETPKVEAPASKLEQPITKPVGGEPPIVPPVEPPKSVVPSTPVVKAGKLWLPEPPREPAEYMPFARKEMAGSFRKKQGTFETVEQAHQQVLKARDMGDNVVPYVQSYIHQVGNVTKEFGIDEFGMATKVGNPGNHSLAINDVLSNPTHYTLTPTQLELAKREGFVYKEALKLAKSYGVQMSELPGVDEAWQYIARRVKGKYNPLTGQYDTPSVPTGGFKMGAKISAQKERVFDEMFEGVDKGFLYENPDQVMAYHIKGIYRLIGNKQAENLVKPLTRAITKKAPLQFGERAIAEPALKSRAAATELANAIDKIYAIETVPKALQVTADVSGAMVGQVAALDITAPFIQGLPVLGHDLKMGLKGKPSAIWAKSYGNMWKTVWNPESINKFRATKPDLYKRAIESGVATGQSEFVSGVGTVQNLLGKIPKVGKTLKEGYRQSWGRLGEAYSDFLEIARIKLFEQMEQSWVRQGGNIYDLGAVINRMTGMASAKARGVGMLRRSSERIAAFAPNYLRANILLMKDMAGRGATAKEVWSSLAAFASVGAAVYYAEEKLRGEEPKMKPWAKKWGGDGADAFTTVIGDTRIGLGSWFYGMIKTVADVGAMAVDEPDALVKFNDQHPIMRFAKSKRGAAWGLVSDLTTGRNFFGQPFKSPTDYLMRIVESVAPISSQSMITQEPKGGIEQVGAEVMGMRAYPTPAKRVAKAVNETMSKLGQPDTESLQKKLEKATTPERKAEIMKQGSVFNISDMGQAIDDATYYLTTADMPKDKYPAISIARVKARKQINEFYSGIPTDKRDSYRAKNPELDAMLFFWGRVEEIKTVEAMRIVKQMMADYGIPESAIPGLSKRRATTPPTLGGINRQPTMPSPLQQYRERRSTMPSPLRGFTR